MEKPPCLPQVRLTPEEGDALDRAMTAYRKRTGRNLTQTDIVREGCRIFCEAEGIEYPTPQGKRGTKRAALVPPGAVR